MSEQDHQIHIGRWSNSSLEMECAHVCVCKRVHTLLYGEKQAHLTKAPNSYGKKQVHLEAGITGFLNRMCCVNPVSSEGGMLPGLPNPSSNLSWGRQLFLRLPTRTPVSPSVCLFWHTLSSFFLLVCLPPNNPRPSHVAHWRHDFPGWEVMPGHV